MRRLIVPTVIAVILVLPAIAQAETVSGTLLPGSLSVSVSNVSYSDTTLTGASQTISANASSAWTAIDARGTGAAWSVSIAATTPTSAAGTVESAARTIAVGNLAISTGSITAAAGSDGTGNLTGASSMALSNSAQTLLSSSGASKGTYTFTPSVAFTIPANAYRSNYAGTVGSSSLNPYVSTITVTVA